MTRDLRKYSQGTNRGLIIGFLIVLFGVGLTLVGLIYGSAAALFGFLCMLAGLAPVVLIWLLLTLMSWIVSRSTDDDIEEQENL